MAITQKFLVGISSNFVHIAYEHQYVHVSENIIKIGDDFGAIFWKKCVGYSHSWS